MIWLIFSIFYIKLSIFIDQYENYFKLSTLVNYQYGKLAIINDESNVKSFKKISSKVSYWKK